MKKTEADNPKELAREKGSSARISPTQSVSHLQGTSSWSGKVILGRTLPSLMDEACQRNANPTALNGYFRKGVNPTRSGLMEQFETINQYAEAVNCVSLSKVFLFKSEECYGTRPLPFSF